MEIRDIRKISIAEKKIAPTGCGTAADALDKPPC